MGSSHELKERAYKCAFCAKVDTSYIPCLYEIWDIEVIGNIYNDSELLKNK